MNELKPARAGLTRSQIVSLCILALTIASGVAPWWALIAAYVLGVFLRGYFAKPQAAPKPEPPPYPTAIWEGSELD